MDMISWSLLLYFTESSWEAFPSIVFSFEVMYQILFNVLGNPQLSMPFIDGFPKDTPIPTHNIAVVTSLPCGGALVVRIYVFT